MFVTSAMYPSSVDTVVTSEIKTMALLISFIFQKGKEDEKNKNEFFTWSNFFYRQTQKDLLR